MDRKDFNVGQKVYLKIIEGSNTARYIKNEDSNAWIKEKVVTKIGTKFIWVSDDLSNRWSEDKFNIGNNFSHHYTCGGQDYKLYLSREEILNDMQCEKIYSNLKSVLSDWKNNGKFTLEQLKKAQKILG